MLKQRPIFYFALLTASGGLLVAGVPVDRVLLLGLFGFMLTMHVGGHGGQGGCGHEGRGKYGHPVEHGHVAPAPKGHEVAAK